MQVRWTQCTGWSHPTLVAWFLYRKKNRERGDTVASPNDASGLGVFLGEEEEEEEGESRGGECAFLPLRALYCFLV